MNVETERRAAMSFLDQLKSVYPGLNPSDLENYLVADCGCTGEVKVVLLCEAPHTAEVEENPRRPLVGASGVSVAAVLRWLVLRDQDTEGGDSIGKLVGDGNEDFDWLGLMNVCPLPMQKTPYCAVLQSRYKWLLDDLKSIRKRRKRTKTRAELSASALGLECAVKNHLADRWNSLSNCVDSEPPLLIACGRTARRFCKLADLRYEDSLKTPHPSRGQWAMALELCKTMEKIRDKVPGQQ